MASAAASSSRTARTPARSRGASWSMIDGQVGRMQLLEAGVRHAQADGGDAMSRPGRRPPSRCSARGRAGAGCARPSGRGPRCPAGAAGRRRRRRRPRGGALPSISSRRRSLTRTTLRPSMSMICLSCRSAEEQQLVVALLELVDLDGRRGQLGAARVEAGDVRPGQEDAPPFRLDDQAGHGRIAVADGDDQVGDLADRLPVAIEDRPADDLAEVYLHLPPRVRVRRPAEARSRASGREDGLNPEEGRGAHGTPGSGSDLHRWRKPPVRVGTRHRQHGPTLPPRV